MITQLEQINSLATAKQPSRTPSEEALRQAAQQFEAILLNQLTATLSSSGADESDEDSLFGNDGGTNLAKQMFSEQLADTMSKSGGVGLADMIMQKFGLNQSKASGGKINPLTKTISAVKDIRGNNAFKPLPNKTVPVSPKSVNEFSTKPATDAQLVSKVENNMAGENINDSDANFTFDAKLLNTAPQRPRVVPGAAINEIENLGASSEIYSAGNKSVSLPNNSMSFSYQLPVNGRLSSKFGNRFHPIDRAVKFHAGVDIAVPKGTRVNTAAPGEVIFAGRKGGYGNLVIIRHPDGKESRYGHLEKILVSEGETVFQGQEIAKSGSTGKSTGPHLHFEIRENGEVVNPLKILSNVLSKTADR